MSDTRERMPDGSPVGSASIRGKAVRKTPLGWIPWLGLLLIVALAVAALLVARNVGDSGDKPGVDLSNDKSAQGSPQAGAGQPSGAGVASTVARTGRSPAPSAAPTSAAAGPTPALSVGGTPVLPLPSSGLDALSGQPVTGGSRVQSVVADEGFWVGSSTTERIFVFLTPQARTKSGESPFKVQAGQSVMLKGTLKPVPTDVARLGLEADEGADQLKQQGQYVEATSLSLS